MAGKKAKLRRIRHVALVTANGTGHLSVALGRTNPAVKLWKINTQLSQIISEVSYCRYTLSFLSPSVAASGTNICHLVVLIVCFRALKALVRTKLSEIKLNNLSTVQLPAIQVVHI